MYLKSCFMGNIARVNNMLQKMKHCIVYQDTVSSDILWELRYKGQCETDETQWRTGEDLDSASLFSGSFSSTLSFCLGVFPPT